MVTFADLIMLMLTFFVMLLGMSSMDRKMLKEIMVHIKAAAGLLEFSGSRGVTDLGVLIRRYKNKKHFFIIDSTLFRDLFIPSIESDRKKEKDLDELMDIKDDERGIVVSFHEDILFDPGEATIKKDAFPVLDLIADAIDSCPNGILVMGHTDNIPIQSELYESKWELSSYRGLSVLEYFLKEKGLSPFRFSVGGYGPSRPLYPNDTPKNRALNRRVEVIFKHL
jgi:chemotaxis protein MotB